MSGEHPCLISDHCGGNDIHHTSTTVPEASAAEMPAEDDRSARRHRAAACRKRIHGYGGIGGSCRLPHRCPAPRIARRQLPTVEPIWLSAPDEPPAVPERNAPSSDERSAASTLAAVRASWRSAQDQMLKSCSRRFRVAPWLAPVRGDRTDDHGLFAAAAVMRHYLRLSEGGTETLPKAPYDHGQTISPGICGRADIIGRCAVFLTTARMAIITLCNGSHRAPRIQHGESKCSYSSDSSYCALCSIAAAVGQDKRQNMIPLPRKKFCIDNAEGFALPSRCCSRARKSSRSRARAVLPSSFACAKRRPRLLALYGWHGRLPRISLPPGGHAATCAVSPRRPQAVSPCCLAPTGRGGHRRR